jgi:hypothetical protein
MLVGALLCADTFALLAPILVGTNGENGWSSGDALDRLRRFVLATDNDAIRQHELTSILS